MALVKKCHGYHQWNEIDKDTYTYNHLIFDKYSKIHFVKRENVIKYY